MACRTHAQNDGDGLRKRRERNRRRGVRPVHRSFARARASWRRNGKKWQFQYDAANRLTNTITPLNRQTSQTYNNRGLLASVKEPSGDTANLYYDARGRLTNRTDNVGTILYRCDANNNVTNIIEAGKTNAWTFDAYDHVSSYTDADGNLVQYRYDQNGNVTNLIYPGNRTVAYFYDSLNRLTNVTDWSNRKTAIEYDLASRVKKITRPNGTSREIGYDAAGQTTNITEKTTGGIGGGIAYFRQNWNNAGRMAWEFVAPIPHTNAIPSRTMTFDDDNRLATFNGQTVVHDADGNMTSGPLTNDTLTTYTYDARNRLTSVGSLSYGYDPAGNRTTITSGTNVTKLVVNPNAKLSQVLMRVRSGVTNYYIYGLGLQYEITETASSTNTSTYHYDYRGSTVALSDSNGNATDRIEYSAYGLTTYRAGTNDTPFLYNGRYGVQTDANGLLYMRARFYNPYICRFVNSDPSGFSGGLNFYAYADGNPVSLLDPFGLGADQAWYDTWGSWIQQGAQTVQQVVANNLPWQAAGYLNTQIDFMAGFLSMPQALGHLGEGTGNFWSNPTLENSAGMFSDVSLFFGTAAMGFGGIPSANQPIGSLFSSTPTSANIPLTTGSTTIPSVGTLSPSPIPPNTLIPIVGQPGQFIRYGDIPYGHIIIPEGYVPNASSVPGSAIGDIMNIEHQ